MYEVFKMSEYFMNLSKEDKRMYSLKDFTEKIRNNLFIVRLRFFRKLCRLNFIWIFFFPIILFWFIVGPRFEKSFRNFLSLLICRE